MVVVRVGCSSCGQPLGIALVGMSNANGRQTKTAQHRSVNSMPAIEEDIPYPADWTKGDIQRLSGSGRISYDDVLDAHEFFSGLGSDWHKHLPKRGKKSAKVISA